MKQENSVELQGMLRDCAVSPVLPDGQREVRMRLVTLHPVPPSHRMGDLPSDSYTHLQHFVRMRVPKGQEKPFMELSETLAKERREPGEGLHPCRIKGRADVEDGLIVVDCTPDGFTQEGKLLSSDNNLARISGTVRSFGNRDNTKVRVSLSEGKEFAAYISRAVSPETWEQFRSGRIRPGDTVLFEGPLFGEKVTDGKTRRVETFLNTMRVTNLSLARKQTPGVSLG